MEKVILEQIKKFVEGVSEGEPMSKLRNNEYVKGYKAGLNAVSDIIEMGEALSKGE